MSWVTIRAVGSNRASRSGPGVTPTLYNEMSLLRNSLLQNMIEEAPVNKNPQAYGSCPHERERARLVAL